MSKSYRHGNRFERADKFERGARRFNEQRKRGNRDGQNDRRRNDFRNNRAVPPEGV